MTQFCDYGCGQEAKYQFKNGKWCCSNHSNKCPYYRKTVSKFQSNRTIEHQEKLNKSYKGRPSGMLGKTHSDRTKSKIRKSLKGRSVWNKGKTNIYSEETLIRFSEVSNSN